MARGHGSADIEKFLLSKIVETGDISSVLNANITADFFASKTNERIFRRLLALKREQGHISLRMVRRDFPEYEFVKVPESWDWLISEIREEHGNRVLDQGLADVALALQDKNRSIAEIRDSLSMLLKETEQSVPQTLDTNLADREQVAARLERYREYERLGDRLLGIPMGFEFIDRATRGFQPKQLVTLVGMAKAGKTTTLSLAAVAAHKAGKKVLLVTFEMTEEEIAEMVDAFYAEISREDIKRGRLDEKGWKELQRSMHAMSGPAAADFIVSNDTNSTMTLTGLASKIDDYKPDLLIVDGSYMMHDENGEKPGSPQALTNITRGMKRLAQNKALPILITTQVLEWKVDRRRGITSGAIGYSSSFAQDSDLIIGVEKDQDDPDVNILRVVLGRHVPTGIYKRVRWNWLTGTHEELEDEPEDDDDQASY